MTEPVAPPVPPRPLSDLAAAIGFLTLLPIGRKWPDDRPPRSVGWYPCVGWLLGGPVALALWGHAHYRPPMTGSLLLLAGVAVVALWAVATRFLHWDGLADAFDGLWGGQTRERRLEFMRDSRIGSFGAAAMVFTALLQVAAVTALIEKGALWVLVAAPVIARFSIALAAWELPNARAEGLGLTAMGAPGLYDRLVAGAAALALLGFVIGGLPTHTFIWVVGIGFVSGLIVPRLLSKPVGGMTGDLFGATVLLVELCVLLTGVLV